MSIRRLELPPLVAADGADDEEEHQRHQKVRERDRDEQPEVAGGAPLLQTLRLGVGALAHRVEEVQALHVVRGEARLRVVLGEGLVRVRVVLGDRRPAWRSRAPR